MQQDNPRVKNVRMFYLPAEERVRTSYPMETLNFTSPYYEIGWLTLIYAMPQSTGYIPGFPSELIGLRIEIRGPEAARVPVPAWESLLQEFHTTPAMQTFYQNFQFVAQNVSPWEEIFGPEVNSVAVLS